MSEKLLPIVPGCLAIVTNGRLMGKEVKVIQQTPETTKIFWRGWVLPIKETGYVKPWDVVCHAPELLSADEKNSDAKCWTVQEKNLMRIDGGDDLDWQNIKAEEWDRLRRHFRDAGITAQPRPIITLPKGGLS